MNIKLFPPEINLIEALVDGIYPQGPDLSHIIIVFPEKRPAHYLRKFLAERIGHGFFPPLCFSINDFIDYIYTKKFGRQDKKLIQLEAIGLLYEIHLQSSQPLGGQAFLNFDNFFSLGSKLFHDLEELKQAQVKPESLSEVDSLIQSNLPLETATRLQNLSFFYTSFYSQLERRGFSTAASRLAFILNNFSPDLFEEEKIILASFFSLTRSEAELIRKLFSLPQTELYFAVGKNIDYLERTLNISLPLDKFSVDADGSAGRAQLNFCMAPDTHGQIFALNQEIEKKINHPQELNERQVIVLPAAETLFPLFQQTLTFLPLESFNISLGYPLSRTPLYSFFDCLFNLIQTREEENRFFLPDYLRFVLHPCTKNIYFPTVPRRSDLTRILFHLIEETMTQQRGRLFWSLEEIERNPLLVDSLARYTINEPDAPEPELFIEHLRQIHRKTIYPFLQIENLGDLARKLIELAEFLATESTASLHAFFEPYFQAFCDQFEALEKSAIRAFRFEQLFSYFHFFRQIMADARVPFPGTPLRGLQVLGFWEARCLPFEEVYMLDMNEEVIPATGKVDSFLPYAVRKALGLPTYEDLERRVEYYFDLMVKGAKKVFFFFIENSEKEKSRLVERLIWEKQKEENQPDPLAFIHSLRYQVALSSPEPRPVAKTQAVLSFLQRFPFSASALDTYLQCPLRFYHGFVLKLTEKEELIEPMEKKDIGSFVHKILEEYFREWQGKNLNPFLLSEESLRKIIEKNFTGFFGPELSGSAYLIKKQVETHLLDFLRNYQIPLIKEFTNKKKPFLLMSLEQRLNGILEINSLSFQVVIKIDRVEKRDDKIYIIDYKTSAREKNYEIKWSKLDLKVRKTWAEAVASLQIPFYTHIWARHFHQKPEGLEAKLLLLGKNNINQKIEYSPFSPEPERRCEELALSLQLIKGLLLEMIDPSQPFSRELAREDSCSRCPYTSLCGQ